MELALFMPLAVFGAVSLGIVYAYSLLVRDRRQVGELVGRYGGSRAARAAAPREETTLLRDRRFSRVGWVDRLLRRTNYAERTALDLARAGMPLRVGEYLLVRWLCASFLALTALLMGQIWPVALAGGVLGFCAPRFYVNHQRKSRVKKIIGQLMDAVTLLANSLKSGYSFGQGIELVSREMPPPIAEEFQQVLVEMNMGGSTEEALANLTTRVPSYDLELVATALLIQRQVGGNLAEILDNIAHTLRERIRILGEVRTRTSQARMSSYIVGGMPFFLMAALTVVNRTYMEVMFASPLGILMLGGALAMEAMGFLVLRRLVAIEV